MPNKCGNDDDCDDGDDSGNTGTQIYCLCESLCMCTHACVCVCVLQGHCARTVMTCAVQTEGYVADRDGTHSACVLKGSTQHPTVQRSVK